MVEVKKNVILFLTLVSLVMFLGYASACQQPAVCGDGIKNGAEQCDLGILGNTNTPCIALYGSSCTYCTATCENKTITNYCGDGIKQESEECDDGNKNNTDNCTNSCKINNPIPPEPTCDHNISVRYSYSNSYSTGIAVGYENGTWITGNTANLNEGIYTIKYYIDNNKEADDNVSVVVKLDGNNLIPAYNTLINSYTSKEITLNTSQLCGLHTISVNATSDGKECDLTDNYASRQIYVNCSVIPPTPSCDDNNACTTDILNGTNCLHNLITCNDNNSSTTDTCNIQTGCIYTPIINPPTPVCGNGIKETGEACDDGNLINGDGCSSTCKKENKDNNCNNGCCEKNTLAQFCYTDWKCTGWSECSNGIMTRQCADNNHCESEYDKPTERSSCSDNLVSKVYANNQGTKNFFIIAGIILFLILLIVLLNLF